MADAATALFVHGAWHGAWCWDRVVPSLESQGIRCVVVDLPTCDESRDGDMCLADDVWAVRKTIDSIDGPVIVIGHSYGGMVITEGAAGCANVRRLVYLAAFMPDVGESVLTLITSGEQASDIAEALRVTESGRSFVDDAQVGRYFYGDCDEETIAWASSRLRSMRGDMTEGPAAVAWRDIPSTFVIAAQDRAIPPSAQRRMSERATECVEWPTSHSPFASQPQLVIDLVSALARR
ncbi:MAG TPA: alpha/beta hydrolase [Dehalococcoidia bacterium]